MLCKTHIARTGAADIKTPRKLIKFVSRGRRGLLRDEEKKEEGGGTQSLHQKSFFLEFEIKAMYFSRFSISFSLDSECLCQGFPGSHVVFSDVEGASGESDPDPPGYHSECRRDPMVDDDVPEEGVCGRVGGIEVWNFRQGWKIDWGLVYSQS